MKMCIQGGMLIDPANGVHRQMDVLIEDGFIRDIQPAIHPNDCEVINAKGRLVLPGFVDMHCHLREPGFEYKETISTGTRAAARGGFTSIVCMANTSPVADNAAVLSFIWQKAQKEGVVRVYPVGAVTKGLKGEELAEMGELKEAGAIALSDDGKPIMNANLMRLAMEYARGFNLLIISHCEDTQLADEGVMNEGYASTQLGLKGTTRAAEEVMIARDIILAEMLSTRIHIAHVSTRGGVELIRHAKMRGVEVTAETAPHYFTATDTWVEGYDANAKVNPPLRTQDDIEAIKEGLQDGTIDCIATDHAPHHLDDKQVEFHLAASGISGFETAFSLAYTHLVAPGILTIDELVVKMSQKPSEILGIPGGCLRIGSPADIVVVDPNAEWVIDRERFLSKGKNTPFHGKSVIGKVCHTLVGGNTVIRNGILTV
jgi:dihydroorotase